MPDVTADKYSMPFWDWRYGLEWRPAVQLLSLPLQRITQGSTEIFFSSYLNLTFHPKQSRLWRAEAMRNNFFFQARTAVVLLLFLTNRLISCQVIHRQEMGSLPSPSPRAFSCLGWFTVEHLSPDGCWSELLGGFILYLPVLRSLYRASVSFLSI